MIKQVIDLLLADDWLVGDDDIDFAKGKYALPSTFKEFKIKRKRWQSSN